MDKNTRQLNLLVKKIAQLKEQLHSQPGTPLAIETLSMYIFHLNQKYGIFLNELLFELYDEYCEDGQMEALDSYLNPEGVPIEIVNEPGETFYLKLKPFPLRFVLEQDERSVRLKVA